MKYLCLVYHDEEQLEALSEREYHAIVDEGIAYRDELRESGYSIASASLQAAHATTTLRVYNGKVSIIDGPFSEAKAQLGGFYVIEARDLNDAIRIATKMPSAGMGYVEVRPIKEHGALLPGVRDRQCCSEHRSD